MSEQTQNINPQDVLAALNSSDVDDIRQAIFSAGELGLTDAIDTLCTHIQSENIGVQEAAEFALRKIRGKQTIQRMLPLLRSESPSLRNISMDVLREIGEDDITSIQPYLRDPDSDLRIFMADILGHTKTIKAVPLLCEALLKDPEVNVRYQAAMSLGNLGFPEAIESLQKAMADEEWVQFSVIEAFIKIRAENIVNVLVSYLDTCSVLVSSVIIDALGELKNVKAVPLLLGFIEKANPVLHHKAVRAIVHILGEGSLYLLSADDQARFKTYLEDALDDEDESIQQAALAGLSAVGDANSSKILMNFICTFKINSEDEILETSIKTLASIGYNESFAEFLKSDDEKIVHAAMRACSYVEDNSCIDGLMNVFWKLDRDSQRLATEYIAKHATERYASFILDILERSDDSEVIKSAIACLGSSLKYAPAQDKIFSMLNHQYPDVKEVAIEACIDLDVPELEQKFVELFENGDDESRVYALYALCNYGVKKHLSIVMQALNDENPSIRQLAVESFVSPEISLREHIDVLLKKLDDEERDVRMAVIDVFGSVNDDFVTPYLINALDDQDEWVCIRAIEALGALRNDTVASLLVERLAKATPMVAFKIIDVLADIGGNVAFSALLGLVSSEDLEIQNAATAAIEKIQAG